MIGKWPENSGMREKVGEKEVSKRSLSIVLVLIFMQGEENKVVGFFAKKQ